IERCIEGGNKSGRQDHGKQKGQACWLSVSCFEILLETSKSKIDCDPKLEVKTMKKLFRNIIVSYLR
ncbi:hypothetical protein DBV15_00153, partial [Temnothorax longispinosus]